MGTVALATARPRWRDALPVLASGHVTLRELRQDDGPVLLAELAEPDVSRFIPPPPDSIAGIERFIDWTWRERAAGRLACFAVCAPADRAIGIVQLRCAGEGCATAEWGVVLGASHWGTGVYVHAAALLIDFAFDAIGVHRLEARAHVANVRGLRALQKVGAIREGVLREAAMVNGRYHDQALYSILADEWRAARASARTGGDGPRGVAAPLAPRPGIEPGAVHPGVLEREQVVTGGDAGAAVAHHVV